MTHAGPAVARGVSPLGRFERCGEPGKWQRAHDVTKAIRGKRNERRERERQAENVQQYQPGHGSACVCVACARVRARVFADRVTRRGSVKRSSELAQARLPPRVRISRDLQRNIGDLMSCVRKPPSARYQFGVYHKTVSLSSSSSIMTNRFSTVRVLPSATMRHATVLPRPPITPGLSVSVFRRHVVDAAVFAISTDRRRPPERFPPLPDTIRNYRIQIYQHKQSGFTACNRGNIT